MKYKVLSVLLLASMMTSSCVLFLPKVTSSHEEYRRVEQNFNKLKVGMTKSEVEKLVGKPRESRTINDKEVWLLHVNSETQGIKWPFVAFDSDAGRVTRIFLEEPDNVFYPF